MEILQIYYLLQLKVTRFNNYVNVILFVISIIFINN